ncbi:unnamed protein product [Somion occarium]|uniref:RlpA-like protein double-psi beta-barrel domain-containing protein n=1 Tax=Somion occarium TaxID=3059160 RepID=A0ABP1CIF7_9APHY
MSHSIMSIILSMICLVVALPQIVVFSGSATFFNPGLDTCGATNTAADLIVKLSTPRYGTGENCFKDVVVFANGASVTVSVVGECPGCGLNDIDLSPGAFARLADLSEGRINVQWGFADS